MQNQERNFGIEEKIKLMIIYIKLVDTLLII